MEQWRDIPGYEGHYQVSDLGNVRSLDRVVRTRNGQDRGYRGMPLRPGRSGKFGHLTVALGKGNSVHVHVAVLLAFTGPAPEGCEGRHWNTDASDNRWANLVWGTRSENNRDASREGRRRVTLEQAAEIRRRARVEPLAALADEFDMCESNARYIATGVYYAEAL